MVNRNKYILLQDVSDIKMTCIKPRYFCDFHNKYDYESLSATIFESKAYKLANDDFCIFLVHVVMKLRMNFSYIRYLFLG